MELRTALALEIGQLNQPVITSYDLAKLIFKLYKTKTYRSEKLTRIRKKHPNRGDYEKLESDLLTAAVLQRTKLASSSDIFTILGRARATAEEITCSVDPFCYVSHMSAMEWHGLTDRIPKILFISSPAPHDWRKFAIAKMTKDLGDSEDYATFRANKLPRLTRLPLTKVGRKTIHRHASLHLGAFTTSRDTTLRVATIGRTFLDMIKHPDLCGGIYHVLEVYKLHAVRYLQLIIDEVDRHGTKIDKIRAGYILDERLELNRKTIEEWSAFAQRGGSMKLDSRGEYSPNFSEKWCLSLNIEE